MTREPFHPQPILTMTAVVLLDLLAAAAAGEVAWPHPARVLVFALALSQTAMLAAWFALARPSLASRGVLLALGVAAWAWMLDGVGAPGAHWLRWLSLEAVLVLAPLCVSRLGGFQWPRRDESARRGEHGGRRREGHRAGHRAGAGAPQFSLRALLAGVTLLAMVFGVLRIGWRFLEEPPTGAAPLERADVLMAAAAFIALAAASVVVATPFYVRLAVFLTAVAGGCLWLGEAGFDLSDFGGLLALHAAMVMAALTFWKAGKSRRGEKPSSPAASA